MFRFTTGLLLVGTLATSGRAGADPITLNDALRRASTRPTVAMVSAERDAARGNAEGAALPLYNPTLEASAGPRWSSGTLLTGVSIGIGQTIELGGKRGARRDAADARLRATELGFGGAQLLARIDAWRAYELAIVARLRVDATKEAENNAAEVVAATQQAQALGSETQLRLNLAASDLGRARHDRADAENAYAAALADLAGAIGALANEHVEPSEAAPALPAVTDENAIVAQALANRPELAEARAQVTAAAADVRSADAAAVPDVTLNVTYGYEPEFDIRTQSLLFGASIALPLRNRNQGQRAATRALEHRAQLESDWLRVQVERDARLAAQRYARALTAVQGFDRDVTEKLHDNLQLATDSFRAGKIDFYAFSIARRDLFANRLGYLDAAAEAVEAWAMLARAAALEVKP